MRVFYQNARRIKNKNDPMVSQRTQWRLTFDDDTSTSIWCTAVSPNKKLIIENDSLSGRAPRYVLAGVIRILYLRLFASEDDLEYNQHAAMTPSLEKTFKCDPTPNYFAQCRSRVSGALLFESPLLSDVAGTHTITFYFYFHLLSGLRLSFCLGNSIASHLFVPGGCASASAYV